MGFSGAKTFMTEGKKAENVLINCEVYFSKLQYAFMKANLSSYNTISKVELSMYRDRIFYEFHKRALLKYLATPSRESHLNKERIDRPWTAMFGTNYVETLRHVSDEHSALEQLRKFNQEDVMNGREEELENLVEVEFSAKELEFLEWDKYRLLEEKYKRIISTTSTVGPAAMLNQKLAAASDERGELSATEERITGADQAISCT
ncbi:unnamed protein product [Strongylus vulgaris]|uniref:Uncharacterized protein n=1 Tax=Strongylus vulgaris TaxID=40348 RepID=A0A3P7IC22_STRVU|nr:unnamed protein product [Strongylus vulgaris]